MAKITSWFDCDLQKAVHVQTLSGNVFSLDNLGSRISVRIFDGGEKATVSGSVTANCILPDGSTANVNGSLTTVDGQSVAYIDVPQSCLLIPGWLKITIKLTDSSVITTLAAILTNVYRTKTDNVITPSQQIINDWNAEISAAIATQNAAIANQDTKITDLKSAFANGTGVRPFIDKGYVKSNGDIVTNANNTYNTGYIPVTQSCKIYAKTRAATSMCAIAFFNSSKGFLQDISITGNGFSGTLTEYNLDLSQAEYSSAAYAIVSFSKAGRLKIEDCYCAVNGVVQNIKEEIQEVRKGTFSAIAEHANSNNLNIDAIIGSKQSYTINPIVINNSTVDTDTGVISDSDSYNRFDYTPTFGGDTLNFSSTEAISNVCFYDENKVFIGFQRSEFTNVNMQGAYYFICRLIKDKEVPTVQISNSRPTLEKVKYKSNENDKYVVKGTQFPGNLINIYDWVDNYYVKLETGNVAYNPNYFCTGLIPVVAGTKYKANIGRGLVWYQSDKSYLSSVSGAAITNGVTAPENAAYIRFNVSKTSDHIYNPYMLYFTDDETYSLDTFIPNLVPDRNLVHDLVNMGWCNRNTPSAIRINYVRDQIYIGYIDNTGNQGIVSYNLETNAINRYIFQKLEADNHNGVSVFKLANNKIMCVCSGHGQSAPLSVYVSKNPEDITEWEKPVIINAPEGYGKISYNQIIAINGMYYIFYRCCNNGNEPEEYWAFISSTDGITWDEENNHVFLYGGGNKYYCVPSAYNNRYIKMFMNSSYSQSASEIRFGYIDTQTGNVLDADMSTILSTISGEPISYTNFSVIVDDGQYGLQILKNLDGTDNAVLYAKYLSSSTSKTFVAIKNNGAWESYELPDPGTVAGPGNANGAVFIDATHYIECRNVSTHYTVELCELSEGVVQSVRTLFSSPNSNIVATYPYYANGYVVFQRGLYTTYRNFDTDAVIKAVN